MDAARELAQLLERGAELLVDPIDQLQRLRVLADAGAQQLQFESERHELLLGAVVQVALHFPPRGVRGFDDAHARGAELLDPGPQVGLQPLVVKRQRGRRGCRLHELLARLQVRRVDDRRDALAFVVDRRPSAVRARLRKLHAVAGFVHELVAVRQPVGDRERAVPEAFCERLAHRRARGERGAQQRAREPARQTPRPVDRRDGQHRHRRGEQAEHDAEPRAEREGPDVPRIGARDPPDAVDEQRDGDRAAGRDQRDGDRRERQPQREQQHAAPERAAAQACEHLLPDARAARASAGAAARGSARRAGHWRACARAPRSSRAARSRRSGSAARSRRPRAPPPVPAPRRAARSRACRGPGPSRCRPATAAAGRRPARPPPRGARPVSAAAVRGAHRPPPIVTEPLPLWRSSENGAPGSRVTPVMWRRGPAASIR